MKQGEKMAKQGDFAVREDVLRFAAEQYGTKPEHLWARTPDAAVLRHPNGKWYGIVMQVSKAKLGLPDETVCDVLNVKCDPVMIGSVLLQKGFFPAYHMNRSYWVSILLDGSVETARVTAAMQASYALIAHKTGGKQRTEPAAWLVPANPKYEDLSQSLAVTGEIFWKQSGKFIVGDTVYIYEGRPIGAVTYACTVTETGIPYSFNQGGLHMETVMRLRLRKRYPQTQFPLTRLQDYGVVSVRGPRHIPAELLDALERE